MSESHMDTMSMIEALQAPGPHPDMAENLMLFGQFVGAWDVDVTNIAADGTRKELKGEWHFGWVLEGRAILDVWTAPRRSLRGQADPYEYGATLRFFDPTIQAWRSTWIGPVRHLVLPFIGRQEKDEIILEGSFTPGSRTRWIFSHITSTSFHWRNQESDDDGASWRAVQEMVAQRVSKDDTEYQ
ncbi:MAG: hypothetical protein H0W02_07355 [Ktedonobacteraceae bacterium]|nr:hypothetical protein [Ktedonobacteraceae bacterium]